MNFILFSAIIALVISLDQSNAKIVSTTTSTSDEITTPSPDEVNETDIVNPGDSANENNSSVGECSVHFLEVNLKSIWGFVIRPTNDVNIGYCSGTCQKSGYYLHRDAINRRVSIPMSEPCCVPIKFQPLSLLTNLFNSKKRKYITSLFVTKDLVISECGCR